LSGGQQQRLALARAIISNPRVLLLDEPLSNLDVKLREQMRLELKRIQREYQVTTIYVTHDQAEALSLSDGLAVMDAGRFLQVGNARDIYERPRDRAVAEFIGQINLLPATALGRDSANGVYRFATAFGTLAVATDYGGEAGGSVTLSVRPENVALAGDGNGPNVFSGRVELVMYYGDHQFLHINAGDRLVAAHAPGGANVDPGDAIRFSIDPHRIRLV